MQLSTQLLDPVGLSCIPSEAIGSLAAGLQALETLGSLSRYFAFLWRRGWTWVWYGGGRWMAPRGATVSCRYGTVGGTEMAIGDAYSRGLGSALVRVLSCMILTR